MRPPRRLSPEEAAVWRRVAETVKPLNPQKAARIDAAPQLPKEPLPQAASSPPGSAPHPKARQTGSVISSTAVRPAPPARSGHDKVGLDSSWERKVARGGMEPDFSLDLHGSTLDQAYSRLIHGLSQAKAMGARVVLVVTGKPRPAEAADRGTARGAIRAKLMDWLGASEHASAIAAIRGAHRRHGGPGAVYIILKRRR
ncbi:Smr/MutS family protein [Novosphingobium sp. RD2P27]|uniref:Smr/MutS family protein n=1 Tax=Novosphingobium kalidii TaxID=3230299 RepID=A0ABV2D0N7_9SPHN